MDELLFAEEELVVVPVKSKPAWKLLVIDDEEEVHSITRMVLEGFEFDGAGIEIISAHTAAEARDVLREQRDIAVMLLDVVMESPHAGLELARDVRTELDNSLVRIILRTGQPGQAPERQVITDYDINDYKSKAELTAQKLFTSVTTAIRSFRDLRAIMRSRLGLEEIIAASGDLFRATSLEPFARGVLTQMTSLLHLEESSLYLEDLAGMATTDGRFDYTIIAGTGEFSGKETFPAVQVLSTEEMALVYEVARQQDSIFRDGCYLGCFGLGRNRHILFLRVHRDLSTLERDLLQIFASNVSVAFESLQLNHEITDTHREVIFTLGEIVENRALVEGIHVHRVSEMARLLAEKAGLSEDDQALLQMALPMHDIGKVAIPDAILLKDGPLNLVESTIMREHPQIGHEILSKSDRPIMQVAARIALEHQESWDGSGYPKGLSGEEIHIFSRIARIVDVFDALLSKRVYKEAWSVPQTLAHLAAERGKAMDPRLVDLVLENADEFLKLRNDIDDQTRAIGDMLCENNA